MFEAVSTDGLVKVVLEDIGEGFCGDYDPNDPLDKRLLRYSLYRKILATDLYNDVNHLCDGYTDPGDWAEVQDGSYCPAIHADAPKDLIEEAGRFILHEIEEGLRNYKRSKRHWEELSWLWTDMKGLWYGHGPTKRLLFERLQAADEATKPEGND